MNYMIRYVDMPTHTRGVTVEDGNGFYNIYINSKLSVAMQQEAIAHELGHIARNDFSLETTLLTAELR